MITIVDYGVGNTASVKRAFEMLSGGHIRVLGVVLNKVKRREAGTYSTYTTYASVIFDSVALLYLLLVEILHVY